ncbi:helix-turn-helix domain-containing protein [Halomicroarcula sp. GCM10025709]|uniref:helix-turn-helix domain-containing protein n=1 Tax=Haloarcula TaxID=2237 RepID=UPI0024C3EE4A|nr:helix-turn-helix domain-containing protein [Halomicroarcula sp. YJ-61-S]
MAVSRNQLPESMVDDEPALDEVMACVFGVQAHEVRTYQALLSAPGSTVEELAAALDRDRSNVNRSLSTLLDKGLASRERRLLDGGGHVYQYTATPGPEARQLMHETLEQWTAAVHDRIDEFAAGTE